MSSPYKEDNAKRDTVNTRGSAPTPYIYTDQRTFGTGRITESDAMFGGLCLRCHPKSSLTDGTNKNQGWKSLDRVHETVKGWGANSEHSFPCAKCHAAHVTSLPRLMITNCLDYKHRGQVKSGGTAGSGGGGGYEDSGSGSFPRGENYSGVNCHPTGVWPDNYWNVKTPW